jgi:hypothetical protein
MTPRTVPLMLRAVSYLLRCSANGLEMSPGVRLVKRTDEQMDKDEGYGRWVVRDLNALYRTL